MHLRTAKDLGAAIRQRRRELKLGQRTLAERVGVSRQWISECEHGKPRAELGLILRTLRALGLKLRIGTDAGALTPIDAPDIDAVVRNARKPPA
ncbi:helix-turn-helix domain-containing protein [Pendulispora rubella]|uniref:Helix-turn-helix domain-containing protein n=1 Tax=Pendulispora rubella TaxID=2741070 RepID=A0ABZ2LIA8_9BACT